MFMFIDAIFRAMLVFLLQLRHSIVNFIPLLGRATIEFVGAIGQVVMFFCCTAKKAVTPPFYWRELLRHIINIGYFSLPVVGFTAIFTGAALALQSYNGFSRVHAESAVAMVVVLSLTRELAPVLTGLMLSGRVGGAIAAEIATMRVSDQIDALHTMRVDPLRFLVAPRLIAGCLVGPFLVLVADVIGIFGGYLVAVYKLGFNSGKYLEKTVSILEVSDIMTGVYKSIAFGCIVCVIGSFYGYNTDNGASGVGKATNSAVVLASIIILLSNYIITSLSS